VAIPDKVKSALIAVTWSGVSPTVKAAAARTRPSRRLTNRE
jgi:hypothetical protein